MYLGMYERVVPIALVGQERECVETYIADHAVRQRFVGWLVEFCAACYANQEVWVVGRCGSHG